MCNFIACVLLLAFLCIYVHLRAFAHIFPPGLRFHTSLSLALLCAPWRAIFPSAVAMGEQALLDEGAVDELREKRVAVTSLHLAEGRKRLEKMESIFVQEWPLKFLSSIDSMKEIFKRLEEEQASWRRERESKEEELCKLRSEVERLQAAVAAAVPPQVCDVDRGSEEIDLKALAEHKWLEGRQALAPITPEAVRSRTPLTKQGALGVSSVALSEKENIRSTAEEIQRLRRENEHLREKASKLSKEYKGLSKEHKGLKSQYHFLRDRLGSKVDAGQVVSNQDKLQAALEVSMEKPSKIRRRSPVEAREAGGGSRTSSDTVGPSTPVDSGILPPQTVAEIVTGPASGSRDRQAEVQAEPAHLESIKEIPQIPSARDDAAGGPDAGLDRADDNSVPAVMTGNRKRSLESIGKQPAKTPAFKFVEPVRKKADRENLQATECKLCKKFYDAVIAGDANGLAESRCTHLDKSRHRFRDLPPATPEGFWNIGFDSDF